VNAIEMEEELVEAKALITTYEVMEDNTQEFERQNRNLKRCLIELAGEFDTYRDCTVFAVARARQYEAEFKAIQEEWDVNHRLRALLLTSGLSYRASGGPLAGEPGGRPCPLCLI
jgi:hypothetical protein